MIDQLVQELTLLGFSPELVRDLVQHGNDVPQPTGATTLVTEESTTVLVHHTTTDSGLKLLYEVKNDFGHLAPRLRIVVGKDVDADTMVGGVFVYMPTTQP